MVEFCVCILRTGAPLEGQSPGRGSLWLKFTFFVFVAVWYHETLVVIVYDGRPPVEVRDVGRVLSATILYRRRPSLYELSPR